MNDQLATKQDLDNLKTEMMQFSRDLQTELLRGIEGLLRPGELRLRRTEASLLTLQASDGAMNERIAALEARLFEVEKKLLMQP